MVRPASTAPPAKEPGRPHHPLPFEGVPAARRHLLVVRHGQSTWNAEGRWQGQADPPLSALGEEQARDAGERLAGIGFSGVVASDLARARRTAEILAVAAGLGLPVQVDACLREIDVGDWTGLTASAIRAGWPGELASWSEGRSASPPGGESRDHLAARARTALSRAAAAAGPGDRLLLVTHGALIRNLDRDLGLAPHGIGNLAGRWYQADGNGLLVAGEPVSLVDLVDRTPGEQPA
jgi:broad specificity phosphatase PhoE